MFFGAFLWRQQRLREAEEQFIAVLRDGTGASEEAHYNLAGMAAGQRRFGEALDHLDEALHLDPNYGVAQELRADVETARSLSKQHGTQEMSGQEAGTQIRIPVPFDEDHSALGEAERAQWRGVMEAYTKRYCTTRELAVEYIRSHPRRVAGYAILVDTLNLLNLPCDALALITPLLDAVSSKWRVMLRRSAAEAWTEQGHFQRAEHEYRRALRERTGEPETLRRMGEFLVAQGRLGLGETLLREAAGQGDKSRDLIYQALSRISLARRRYEDALHFAELALEVEPGDPELEVTRRDARKASRLRERS